MTLLRSSRISTEHAILDYLLQQSSIQSIRVLLSDHNIRQVFGIAQTMTKALIGIGTSNLTSSLANSGLLLRPSVWLQSRRR